MVTAGLLAYYATHGDLTDPGLHRAEVAALPHDVPALCRFIQSRLVHSAWAAAYDFKGKLSRETLAVADRLDLDGLSSGTCRDFALLLCGFLRERGVPARVRCGFATYFKDNPFEDHWVCEYWRADENRWVLADAQIDDVHREQLGIRFDPADLPPDKFLNAGEAWALWRGGKVSGDDFGNGPHSGAWLLRVDLMRDQLALRKCEVSDWDRWRDLSDEDKVLSADVLAECDRIAAATKDGSP
jgi:hypothetical protein